MAFRALFLASVADCFLHGPGVHEEKIAGVLLSIIAVVLDVQLLYFVAEAAWAVVFFRAHLASASARVVVDQPPSEAAAAAPIPAAGTGSSDFPIELKNLIDSSKENLIKNVENLQQTCDGQPWKLSSDKNGVKVWWAPYPGKSFLRYKTEFSAYGPRQGVYEELFDYGKRCKSNGGWDDALDWGKVIKELGDGYRIVEYATTPQYGGRISSREFVDGRLIQDRPDGGLIVVGANLDAAKFPALCPPKPAGVERGTSYPGSGCILEPLTTDGDVKTAPREWKITIVAAVDIGGSIPQWMTNSATSSVLQSSSEGTKKHLAKCFPR